MREAVRDEQEQRRAAGEHARMVTEEGRAAAETDRLLAMDAVRTTTALLTTTIEQMKVVEEMRRALRAVQDVEEHDAH